MRDLGSTTDVTTNSGADKPTNLTADHTKPEFNTLYNAAIGKNVDTSMASLPLLTLEDKTDNNGKTQSETVDVNGTERTYSVHTPKGWDGKTPLKVMYFFNGFSPGAKTPDDTFTGLSQMSDKDGFMLVDMIGAGPDHTFNNGQGLFNDGLNENNYLNAVHQKLQSQYPIDQTHEGLVGFSQGGSEALALASQNKWVSSVQTVEGYETGQETPLTRPVSAQIINAEKDPVIPIGGTRQLDTPAATTGILGLFDPLAALIPAGYETEKGAINGAESTPGKGGLFSQIVSKVEGTFLGGAGGLIDDTVAPLLENFGLSKLTFGLVHGGPNYIEPQTYAVNAFTKADGTGAPTVTQSGGNSSEVYSNTATGAEVKAVQLGNGTHGWAGSTDHSNDIPGIGMPNETYNASEEISQFFMQHAVGH
jgi:poly(3-hydroxybutyrate) depolymerase